MNSSRKNPSPPLGRSSEIPRGREVLKVKLLEEKYEAKLQFPGGTGGEKKLELHILSNKYSGTRLIWTPRGQAKVSVLTGVRIKRLNFRENV